MGKILVMKTLRRNAAAYTPLDYLRSMRIVLTSTTIIHMLLLFLILAPMIAGVRAQDNEPLTMTYDNIERSYYRYVPSSYDENQPAPLVVALHGAGGSGKEMLEFSGMTRLADESGAVVIFPDGVNQHWSYVDVPLDDDDTVQDDTGFITALIDEAISDLNIDTSRLYVTGFSNGGLMAVRLRCELDTRLAAVAVIGATMTFTLAQECLEAKPMPYLMAIGTRDQAFPWDGYAAVTEAGWLTSSFSAIQTMTYQASLNKCSSVPSMEEITHPDGTNRVIRQSYDVCADDASVVLLAMVDVGHTWPANIPVFLPDGAQLNVVAAAWRFMMSHHRDKLS